MAADGDMEREIPAGRRHGFAGTFFWGEMVAPLQRGYATAVTDDGHTAPTGNAFDMSWAIGHPEAVTDFAVRGVHELAVKAKLIIAAHYGRPQQYAYFHGCSDGGREGMKSAQIHPDEFNGIIAGRAFTYWSGSSTQLLAATTNLTQAGIQGTSGAALLTLAQKTTYATCDATDGVTDGIINNPSRCTWDPATVVCKSGQDPATCMTAAQANTIKSNEVTVVDPVSGQYILSNWTPGSEFEQIRRGWHIGLNRFGIANYQLGLNDASYDGTRFDLASQWPTVSRTLANIDALDPDLRPAKQAGAKVIQWHGWSDTSITPGGIVRYYDSVVQQTSAGDLSKVQDFYRLFMLPGVGHCGTGVGPDNIGAENQTPVVSDAEHDIVTALEAWVEKGIAPRQLVASKVITSGTTSGITMQRPICVYPSEAVYNGAGDTNNASNFHCSPAP